MTMTQALRLFGTAWCVVLIVVKGKRYQVATSFQEIAGREPQSALRSAEVQALRFRPPESSI